MTLDSTILIAYIDPGTGPIIAQIILAGVLTGGVAFRRFLMWPVKQLLGSKAGSPKSDARDRELSSTKATDSQR